MPREDEAKSVRERRGRSHSNDDTHQKNDASVTVSNNPNVVIGDHNGTAVVDAVADSSVLSGKLSRRLWRRTTRGNEAQTANQNLPKGECADSETMIRVAEFLKTFVFKASIELANQLGVYWRSVVGRVYKSLVDVLGSLAVPWAWVNWKCQSLSSG